MTTETTNKGSDVRLREKKVVPSKQNGNVRDDETKSLSIPTADSTAEEMSNGETTTSKPQASTFEQAFFFGLTIDDALNSTDNLPELLYNACKYNHLDLVKRIIDEKPVNINEPFNNDYPLCIAR
jgi:hypothetical protein